MPKKHEIERLAEMIDQEITNDADELAVRLMGKRLPDSHNMQKDEYLDYYRRNWGDAKFRSGEVDRVGGEKFLATAYEAFGLAQPEDDVMEQAVALYRAQAGLEPSVEG